MKSQIITIDGNKFFEIDNKKYLPAAMRSFRPTPANVSLFYRNGTRLFQFQCGGILNTMGVPYSLYGPVWIGDHKYNFRVLDKQIKMFLKFAPDAYLMPMVLLDMPDWWMKENNCDTYSFTELCEATFIEKWINDASDFLRAFIEYTEENWGDKVFAYSFSAGDATEWFDHTYSTTKRKIAGYRKYVGDSSAVVPSREEVISQKLPTFYDNDMPIYKYLKYCSTLVPNLINHFADVAQKVLNHNKIIGCFYGYTDCPECWQNQTSTTGYEAVWKNPNIDMLFSPASYGNSRLANGVSSYQYTVDSVNINQKLYLHEIDHRTHLSNYPWDMGKFMNIDYEDDFETIRVLRRELCATVSKGGAFWWFDFYGGYYASPLLEKEIELQHSVLEKVYSKPHKSVSEIAVFVDPQSFLHMKDTESLTMDFVRHNRDSLHECGAPYDYYNLNDITRIDVDDYKVFIFLNALDISDTAKACIKEKLKGKTKVWLYAPNVYSGGTDEVLGIKLKKISETEAKINYKNISFGFTNPAEPMYAVDDNSAEVIARYDNGEVAVARKDNDIYIATGNVPSKLWRDIIKEANVHIYTDNGGALYVDSRLVARQTMDETDSVIIMPFDCVLEELFDGGEYKTEDKKFSYHSDCGETKLFLIKEKF